MKVSFQIIGHNIKEARQSQRLTQQQAAERLGMSVLHYGRLERGERPASLDLLAQIAGALSTSVYALIQDSILDKENHPAIFESPDSQTREYGEYALVLLDEYREQIRKYYKALKDSELSNSKDNLLH